MELQGNMGQAPELFSQQKVWFSLDIILRAIKANRKKL